MHTGNRVIDVKVHVLVFNFRFVLTLSDILVTCGTLGITAQDRMKHFKDI